MKGDMGDGCCGTRLWSMLSSQPVPVPISSSDPRHSKLLQNKSSGLASPSLRPQ